MSTCNKCLPGYFLKKGSPNECVPCGDVDNGGREGCSACSNTNAFKCTDCKPNYRKQQNGGASDDYTCTKVCEDETACGGPAGACDAIVIGASGEMTYYCSQCVGAGYGPINGKCSNNLDSNTCKDGVCTSCTTGYFLYMGGCYKADTEPGSLMCSKASIIAGVCETPNTNSRYFAVPGAAKTDQSVLACGNPVGTTTGSNSDIKAYVGVEDCATCEAPVEASNGAMAPARCTACGSDKKPSLLGSGCFTCTVEGCSHCSADGVCEACTSAEQRPSTDGKQCIACNISGCTRCSETSKCSQCDSEYRLEGEACVRTGSNLSTEAIAGISVTKSSYALCC